MIQQVLNAPVNTTASGSGQTTKEPIPVAAATSGKGADTGFLKKGQSMVLSSKQIRFGDGDTFEVTNPDNPKEKMTLRLPWDSPETKHTRTSKTTGLPYTQPGQNYGNESAQALRNLIGDQEVTVTVRGKDNKNRDLVDIRVGGKDLGVEMIRNGHAWNYSKYAPKAMTPEEQKVYKEAQSNAMKQRLGLWAEDSPTYPELFRRNLRND